MLNESIVEDVFPQANLVGVARTRGRRTEQISVLPTEIPLREEQGWEVLSRSKTKVRMARGKAHEVLLEDRVWSLLWKLGFPYMSGARGAVVVVSSDPEKRVTSQVDALAVDSEICVAIECKSMAAKGRRPSLQQELAKHGLLRERLAQAVKVGKGLPKRVVVLAFWTSNAIVSNNDRERAKAQNIVLFDEVDLDYYEALAAQIGPAARYQFLADLAPGRQIPGLQIRVPALRAKMGGYPCYTFSASPEWLLKVAYVSHRARGKRSDVRTYQRIIRRSRMTQIKAFLSDPSAIFPTNIVVNLEEGRKGTDPIFEPVKQEGDPAGATLGWLTLRPTYKSAWVIDGQHRLYAYSGHARASKDHLAVLAFEGLPGSVQQRLFIDINGKQKKVGASLLQELYADINRDSDDPKKLTQALISEAVQYLDKDPSSPLFKRVLLADERKTPTRCISLTALFSALEKPGFYYASVSSKVVRDPGPFYSESEEESIRRSTFILNGWLSAIRERTQDWWDLGQGPGGGLAMNDGVTVCLNVLRSVVDHLDEKGPKLADGTAKEAVERLTPFAAAVAEYFGSLTGDQRREFRALRGVQGQTAGTRHVQQHIQGVHPAFQPQGLGEFSELERERTNDQAMSFVARIERILSQAVVAVLEENLGVEGDRWWYEGVPAPVRTAVTKVQEDDKNSRGRKDAYLNLIHYRDIIINNWTLLGPLFGYGTTGKKEARTEWLVEVNRIRQVAAHASSGATVSWEQLSQLEEYLDWLRQHIATSDAEELYGEPVATDAAAQDVG